VMPSLAACARRSAQSVAGSTGVVASSGSGIWSSCIATQFYAAARVMNQKPGPYAKLRPMPLILILVILLLLFGGGGYYMGPGVGYYGGGGLSLVLLIVILFLLFGRGRGRL
jgi:hypothetical protein